MDSGAPEKSWPRVVAFGIMHLAEPGALRILAFPVLLLGRLEFLPGTAITTAARVVRDECEETDLGKTRMFAAGTH